MDSISSTCCIASCKARGTDFELAPLDDGMELIGDSFKLVLLRLQAPQ
jgi:hypothetical protein